MKLVKQELVPCACGCGKLINPIGSQGRVRRYLWRHGSGFPNFKNKEATKKKISEGVKKNPNRYWLGKKRPDISKLFKNRIVSLKTRKLLSEKMKGKFKGEKSWNWKGGRSIGKDKYVYILMPTHPYCNKKGYYLEHRFVMEQHIGRHLLPTEVVHHINGDTEDNRIENLMLFTNNSEHMRHHRREERNEVA